MDPAYAARYADLARRHWWWRARNCVVEREVWRVLGPRREARILDVGCGDGLLFPFLSRFGEVEGVEPDEATLSPSNPWRDRIHVCGFDDWSGEGSRFDLVLMLDVIEHVAEPVSALRHVAALLAPRGRVLITAPAFNLLWTTHDELNRHHTRFTGASLASAAARAGLKLMWTRYLFQALVLAKLLQRTVEAILQPPARLPRVPSPRLNELLYRVCRAEALLLSRWAPVGSSVMAVAGRVEVPDADGSRSGDTSIDKLSTLP